MKCYIVMAMLLAIYLDVSEGRQGDCDTQKIDGRTACELYCGFTTSWSACADNKCCCGYDRGWKAFRFNEGEKCSGDVPETPKLKCNPQECQQACGGVYSCILSNTCACPVLFEDNTLGWVNKIWYKDDGSVQYF